MLLIKLTCANNSELWVNPLHIIKMEERTEEESSTALYLTPLESPTAGVYHLVKESPDEINTLIRQAAIFPPPPVTKV